MRKRFLHLQNCEITGILCIKECIKKKPYPFFVIFSPYLCIHYYTIWFNMSLIIIIMHYILLLPIYSRFVTRRRYRQLHTHTFYLLYTYIYSALGIYVMHILLGFLNCLWVLPFLSLLFRYTLNLYTHLCFFWKPTLLDIGMISSGCSVTSTSSYNMIPTQTQHKYTKKLLFENTHYN